MTRRIRNALISVGAAILVFAAAVIWLVQSDWLREKLRAGIVAQAQKATGGKVEIGAFRFDWHTWTAEVDRLVIHGTEPAGQAPLLAVDRLVAGIRVTSFLRRDIGIASVEADRPRVHVIVYPDGRTNLPPPKTNRSRKSVPETILDLKLSKFDLKDGSFLAESPGMPPRSIPWSARGEKLSANIAFDAAGPRYSGDITLGSLHTGSADVRIGMHASMERDRIVIANASVRTAESEIFLKDVAVNHFAEPVATGQYEGRLSLAEMTRIFRLKGRQRGMIEATGTARFVSVTDYRITGKVRGSAIEVATLRSMHIAAALDAGPNRIELSGVRVNVLGGEVSGRAEIRDLNRFGASGQLSHFNLREIAAIGSRRPLPYDGLISGPFQVSGRLDTQLPDATLHATISPAASGPAVHGDVALEYDASTRKVRLGESWLQLPHTHVNVSGTLGERLEVKAESTDAADILPALEIVSGDQATSPSWNSVSFDGTLTGPLENLRIAGHAAGSNVAFNGDHLDSFTGDLIVSRSLLTVGKGSIDYLGLHADASGSLALTEWRALPGSKIAANIQLANADMTKILSIAGHKEIEVSGTVNATAQVAGTLGEPLANGDLSLARGFIYGQPFDTISGRAQSIDRNTQALTGVFISGPKRVNIAIRFEHAGTQFPAGRLEFNLTSNTMPLNQIALVRRQQPDIHGFGKFHADGAIRIEHDAKHEIQFDLLNLNADASANEVELAGRNLGDAHFTAKTAGGVMTAHFDSNAAKASIFGEGTMRLADDYPVNGTITFSNAGLNALATLIATPDQAKDLNFDGTAQGTLTINGPARKPGELKATLDIPQLEFRPLQGSAYAQNLPDFVVRNNGPIRISLMNSVLQVESARFHAPETDVTFTGSAAFARENSLNLRAQGNINLALARTLSPDLTSSGSLTLNATVRGTWTTPDVSGQALLRNGDFHYAGFSNGLTKANGELRFNGTRATIQSFSAESGGGKVDATGFAALTGDLLTFRIEARGREVRVRYPEGVSSVSDATLTFAGTSQRSEASGNITIHRVAINPRSDAATILALSAEPVRTPSAKNGLAANMNLDVQIETAPDVALQTSVTESVQADANLRLRGTATNPAVLGRINITDGELIFFGNKYSINQGSISFFDPVKIDPILNVDLETKARGVDVILTVSGPITKLNLSYRSDPPLQFSDIVALLATGRAPTDPTLALGETGQSQTFQNLGASDLIGQAIANPVAGRLQRFFGVSRIKIDPQLTGVTGSPEARLTIEQQVTPEILFTYITDVSSTSTQLIRVEWSFNRHWSAILIREENGYVGLDFAYKKRFK